MSYHKFAKVYDSLMEDVPYDEWVAFTKSIINQYSAKVDRIIDLGTGTGEIALRLSRKGYTMTGVDLSEEMLAIAQQKAADKKQTIQWLHQDIAKIKSNETYDMAISYCDVLNYIQGSKQVIKVIDNVFDLLKPGGYFLFDVHSVSYVQEFLANKTFGKVTDDISFIWFCDKGDEENKVHHDLTFFVRSGEKFERFDEYHTQQTFPVEDYVQWLQEAGFYVRGIYSDFSTEKGYNQKEDDRIFFVCQKPLQKEEP